MAVKCSFYFIGLFFLFTACKNDKQLNIPILSINKSLEKSTLNLKQANAMMYLEQAQRLVDPPTAKIADNWQSRFKSIQQLSSTIFNYIDSIKKEAIPEKRSVELFEKLKNYQRDIFNVDSQITYRLREHINPITYPFDISKQNANDFFKTFFSNHSQIEVLIVLNCFQNNIMLTENEMVSFFLSQVAIDAVAFDKISFLIGQSHSHLKAGDMLEVGAGIGEYSIQSQPRININGKGVECVDAVANYKFKVSDKPGKHFVPVKIDYTDQNGKHQFFTKKIEYTVDE